MILVDVLRRAVEIASVERDHVDIGYDHSALRRQQRGIKKADALRLESGVERRDRLEDVNQRIGPEVLRHIRGSSDHDQNRLDVPDLQPRPAGERPEVEITRVEIGGEQRVREPEPATAPRTRRPRNCGSAAGPPAEPSAEAEQVRAGAEAQRSEHIAEGAPRHVTTLITAATRTSALDRRQRSRLTP